MQRINEWYNMSCNIESNSTLIWLTELRNKRVREVTNDIGIMSQREWPIVYKKDLIFCTHHSGGGLHQKNVTHFVTQWVVPEVMALLFGENKRQTFHNSG